MAVVIQGCHLTLALTSGCFQPYSNTGYFVAKDISLVFFLSVFFLMDPEDEMTCHRIKIWHIIQKHAPAFSLVPFKLFRPKAIVLTAGKLHKPVFNRYFSKASKTLSKVQAKERKRVVQETLRVSTMFTFTPVSYTHLDVYKRQITYYMTFSPSQGLHFLSVFYQSKHIPQQHRNCYLSCAWNIQRRLALNRIVKVFTRRKINAYSAFLDELGGEFVGL